MHNPKRIAPADVMSRLRAVSSEFRAPRRSSLIEAWDEAMHPRGKTTPRSNRGSFASRLSVTNAGTRLPAAQAALFRPHLPYSPDNWRERREEDHVRRRELQDFVAHPPKGTVLWRGEDRVGEPGATAADTGVGMHWTATPNAVLPHRVVWEAVLEDPSTAISRGHPVFYGRSRPLEWEAEIRLKPGSTVKINGAWVWEGPERASMFWPFRGNDSGYPGDSGDRPGRWVFVPLNTTVPVTGKGHGHIDYSRFPDLFEAAVNAGAAAVLRERFFDEDRHPRGKTSPGTNSGSFREITDLLSSNPVRDFLWPAEWEKIDGVWTEVTPPGRKAARERKRRIALGESDVLEAALAAAREALSSSDLVQSDRRNIIVLDSQGRPIPRRGNRRPSTLDDFLRGRG